MNLHVQNFLISVDQLLDEWLTELSMILGSFCYVTTYIIRYVSA